MIDAVKLSSFEFALKNDLNWLLVFVLLFFFLSVCRVKCQKVSAIKYCDSRKRKTEKRTTIWKFIFHTQQNCFIAISILFFYKKYEYNKNIKLAIATYLINDGFNKYSIFYQIKSPLNF